MYIFHATLLQVPQPPNTALARRIEETPNIPADQRPLYRTDDGFGNDAENPGAGAEGATIGRNMPIVPESAREAIDYPCAPLLLTSSLHTVLPHCICCTEPLVSEHHHFPSTLSTEAHT